MKGNNEIRFNQSTLVEAMQEYFDKRLVLDDKPICTITSVDADHSKNGGCSLCVVVKTAPVEGAKS